MLLRHSHSVQETSVRSTDDHRVPRVPLNCSRIVRHFGDIASYAYLEGKAFRHGDIEDVLEELARGSGGAAGLLGAMTGGLLAKKWSGLDIKVRFYTGYQPDCS